VLLLPGFEPTRSSKASTFRWQYVTKMCSSHRRASKINDTTNCSRLGQHPCPSNCTVSSIPAHSAERLASSQRANSLARNKAPQTTHTTDFLRGRTVFPVRKESLKYNFMWLFKMSPLHDMPRPWMLEPQRGSPWYFACSLCWQAARRPPLANEQGSSQASNQPTRPTNLSSHSFPTFPR
jgi:hypothetical protein